MRLFAILPKQSLTRAAELAAVIVVSTAGGASPMSDETRAGQVITELAATIRQRRSDANATSYTRQLLDAGVEQCAKKLGEEAVETVIAALGQDDAALRNEAADLIYHLLVVLECRKLEIADVLGELQRRMGTSGLAEKAARKPT